MNPNLPVYLLNSCQHNHRKLPVSLLVPEATKMSNSTPVENFTKLVEAVIAQRYSTTQKARPSE
jgi:hypothetical protein